MHNIMVRGFYISSCTSLQGGLYIKHIQPLFDNFTNHSCLCQLLLNINIYIYTYTFTYLYIYPGIPTTIKTMSVNITTIDYLRVLIIEIGSTIILMVVEAQGIHNMHMYIFISCFISFSQQQCVELFTSTCRWCHVIGIAPKLGISMSGSPERFWKFSGVVRCFWGFTSYGIH